MRSPISNEGVATIIILAGLLFLLSGITASW